MSFCVVPVTAAASTAASKSAAAGYRSPKALLPPLKFPKEPLCCAWPIGWRAARRRPIPRRSCDMADNGGPDDDGTMYRYKKNRATIMVPHSAERLARTLELPRCQLSQHGYRIADAPCAGFGSAEFELGDHLVVDDPVGDHIGDGTFQSIAHGDEDPSFPVPGLRGDRDDDAVVEFSIADPPFASDTGCEIDRLPQSGGDDHHAVGRGVIERRIAVDAEPSSAPRMSA